MIYGKKGAAEQNKWYDWGLRVLPLNYIAIMAMAGNDPASRPYKWITQSNSVPTPFLRIRTLQLSILWHIYLWLASHIIWHDVSPSVSIWVL